MTLVMHFLVLAIVIPNSRWYYRYSEQWPLAKIIQTWSSSIWSFFSSFQTTRFFQSAKNMFFRSVTNFLTTTSNVADVRQMTWRLWPFKSALSSRKLFLFGSWSKRDIQYNFRRRRSMEMDLTLLKSLTRTSEMFLTTENMLMEVSVDQKKFLKIKFLVDFFKNVSNN